MFRTAMASLEDWRNSKKRKSLILKGARWSSALYSYVKQNSTAEIEFLIQKRNRVIPIEVKNNSTKAKSLSFYMSEFAPVHAVKLSQSIGGESSELLHLPIYRAAYVATNL